MSISQERQVGVEITPAMVKAGKLGCGPDYFDGLSRHINKLVESWNNWVCVAGHRSHLENYVNRDWKFLFEYVGCGRLDNANVDSLGSDIPPNGGRRQKEIVFACADWEVREQPLDLTAGQACVVTRWDKQPMLVQGIELMNEVEEFVPARITVGLQIDQRLEEAWGDPLGQSIFYGFLKPCSGFGKRELNVPLFSSGWHEGGDDIPVRMVKAASEIVNNVTADSGCRTYDGFVLFDERGTLAGISICLDDEDEGTLLAKELVELKDVFCGPVNF